MSKGVLKNIMIVFGLLDLLLFISCWDSYLLTKYPFSLPGVVTLLIYLSLLLSSYLLYNKPEKGVNVYFIQVPFRILFYFPTFSFLSYLIEPGDLLLISVCVLESLRIFLSWKFLRL